MENEFVSYEIALALKELGFDEPCLAWYGSKDMFEISGRYKNSTHTVGYCVSAPTFSQVFRWFREKYKSKFILSEDYYWTSGIGQIKVNSYEEAQLECLVKLIEIVKSQKQ